MAACYYNSNTAKGNQLLSTSEQQYAMDDEEGDLYITDSAEGILGVSPVNTMEAEPKNFRTNDDAFSSSSSEGDDSDDEEPSYPRKAGGFTSEFDKAARYGKASRGNFQGEHERVSPIPASLPPIAPKKPSIGTTSSSVTSSSSYPRSNRDDQASTISQQQKQHQQQRASSQVGSSATHDAASNGILPDVLLSMRQQIESLTLFDSDMIKLAHDPIAEESDPILMETRESLKRSSQQSISAAVLVSLAHKRYERRRLAAMEIEKVVRSLVQQEELERVRAILLLLSDDYVRSTSEDARKGGVVALAASAIGLKKASESSAIAQECRDLILASVVHACQDHSQRVRYYATESLFNVVKVIPSLAVQHFFILFEILRSLYADVDVDVKSGAELLDKKLKEVIVGAMNSGKSISSIMLVGLCITPKF